MSTASFVWLEITGRCQLECQHCYAESGPRGSHGKMTDTDWFAVIDQVAALGTGTVQFIGGEPTLHPDLPAFIDHALAAGLNVEVFSNLVHVTPTLWEAFALPGVRLACSYYSDQAGQHTAVTKRAGSHERTRANIIEAVRRSIPLRVGVIGLTDDQRVDQAVAELTQLGVTTVRVDHMRSVGRGGPSCADALCGQCVQAVAAVATDGSVWPCVFSRWLPVGNVRDTPLAEILGGERDRAVRGDLAAHFATRSIPSWTCMPIYEHDSEPVEGAPDVPGAEAYHCIPYVFEPEAYFCVPTLYEEDATLVSTADAVEVTSS